MTQDLKITLTRKYSIPPDFDPHISSLLNVYSPFDRDVLPRYTTVIPLGFKLIMPPNTLGRLHICNDLARKSKLSILDTTLNPNDTSELSVTIANHGRLTCKVKKSMKIATLTLHPMLDLSLVAQQITR